MDKEFLDKLVTEHSKGATIFEGLGIMNNNSFFSTIVEVKPYKLVSTAFGSIDRKSTRLNSSHSSVSRMPSSA